MIKLDDVSRMDLMARLMFNEHFVIGLALTLMGKGRMVASANQTNPARITAAEVQSTSIGDISLPLSFVPYTWLVQGRLYLPSLGKVIKRARKIACPKLNSRHIR